MVEIRKVENQKKSRKLDEVGKQKNWKLKKQEIKKVGNQKKQET